VGTALVFDDRVAGETPRSGLAVEIACSEVGSDRLCENDAHGMLLWLAALTVIIAFLTYKIIM
jgi:hypothetical protein